MWMRIASHLSSLNTTAEFADRILVPQTRAHWHPLQSLDSAFRLVVQQLHRLPAIGSKDDFADVRLAKFWDDPAAFGKCCSTTKPPRLSRIDPKNRTWGVKIGDSSVDLWRAEVAIAGDVADAKPDESIDGRVDE